MKGAGLGDFSFFSPAGFFFFSSDFGRFPLSILFAVESEAGGGAIGQGIGNCGGGARKSFFCSLKVNSIELVVVDGEGRAGLIAYPPPKNNAKRFILSYPARDNHFFNPFTFPRSFPPPTLFVLFFPPPAVCVSIFPPAGAPGL